VCSKINALHNETFQLWPLLQAEWRKVKVKMNLGEGHASQSRTSQCECKKKPRMCKTQQLNKKRIPPRSSKAMIKRKK
jgi:hypothetical protein